MQTNFSLLPLALSISNVLAAPATVSRPNGQKQTSNVDYSQADLVALTTAVQASPPAGRPALEKTATKAQRAEDATSEISLSPFRILPRGQVAVSEPISVNYAKEHVRSIRRSSGSDTVRENVTVQSFDDAQPEDDGLLLGREPRRFGKRLGISLLGGAFGAMVAQVAQTLVLGSSPLPLKEKRSLPNDQDESETEERMVPQKRATPSFFDALGRKLFEKIFTSGGAGAIYQPLRWRFRDLFGKSQHGHP